MNTDYDVISAKPIPGFEFPRHNLYDYNLSYEIKKEDEVQEDEIILGVLWYDTLEEDDFG